MKLSIKPLVVAGALFNALHFVFVAVLNFIWSPYGGTYLGMLTSLYPGYSPEAGPISIIVGGFYALAAGAAAGALFGWLYNSFVELW